MKAAVLRGAGKLAVEEVDLPQPGPGQALLKVMACGVCGGDIRALRNGLRVDLPCQILGHEFAGEVVHCGDCVTQVKIGDRLAFAADLVCRECWYCRNGMQNLCDNHRILGAHVPGGLAEYVLLSEDILNHATYHPVPEGVSWPAASMAEPASSVIASQEMADIGPGQVVAIMGSGPIGCLHIEVAISRGAVPVLIGRSAARLEFASKLRPEVIVLDSATENIGATLHGMTEGRGVDVAIIAAPSGELQSQAIDLVRKRGTLVLFGGLPKQTPMVSFDANKIHYRELKLVGAFSYQASHHAKALDLISQGIIQADRYCTLYPLNALDQMFDDAANGRVMKAVAVPVLG